MTQGPLAYLGRLPGGTVSALVFFTRMPVARWYRDTPVAAQDAMVYAPVVGALLGACGAALLVGLGHVLPPMLAAALTVAALVLATGALHEDAFADYCDGFGAGGDSSRIIEIMRDPRCGSFGVAGLALVLLVQVLALGALLESAAPWALAALLAIAFAGSRYVATAFMAIAPRVSGDDSKLERSGDPIVRGALVWASLPVLGAAGALLVLDWQLVLSVLALPLAGWWLARRFLPTLGGYTGDCLGAVIKLGEVACLVVACALS